MHNTEFIAFDLETTGLHPTFCKIVEIGAVKFRSDGTVVDCFEQLVNPDCPIPTEVIKVHGITDKIVSGQPSIEEVLPEFVQFLGSTENILMAHNAAFDLGFLAVALDRFKIDIPQNPVVDTLDLSRRWLRLPNNKLGTVSRHFKVTDQTEHRALDDALVVKEVFLRLMNQQTRINSIDELFNATNPFYFEEFVPRPVYVPAEYQLIVEAIEIRRSISITYEGASRGKRRRQITPKKLIESRGYIYLVALCHIDDKDKHFRLDRILEIE